MSQDSFRTIVPREYGIFILQDVIKQILLKDGTRVWFRPLTPGDIPLWIRFIQKCSRESLHYRFQGTISVLDDQGNQYCKTDYDTNISIAAEIDRNQEKEIIAIAWLIKDKKNNHAECALLVCDEWQYRSVGNELGKLCQDIAIKWGIKELTGTTTTDNYRVIKMLQKNGFSITHDQCGTTIVFRKTMSPRI